MTKQTELPWMAKAESYLGLREIPGAQHNPEILRWLAKFGGYNGEDKAWWRNDEEAWCGLFAGMCLGEAGRYVVKTWYRAGAWADEQYLTKLDKPAYGCLAVKKRTGGNHVFFVAGRDKQGRLMGLGGNQGNRVSIIPFDAAGLRFYWPSHWRNGQCVKSEPQSARYELPIVDATGRQGESEA